ncbi:MAG TPA: cytochrome c3 family protein, partial [Pyrinomonadaceae bacterium]|nr:cytochrome c3 family protein [Pyrinomonadaceae bacterium]
MRQSESLSRQLRRRVIALTIFCGVVALLSLYPHVSSTAFEPQGRRRQPPRTTRPQPKADESQTTGRGGRNYSRFKHEDHRAPVAKLDCADCHAIPNAAAPDTVAAATKPSVKGYPYHDSCVRCHRQEFFRGAAPAICNVCHTRSSPRLTARDMDPFPKEGDQLIAREFPGYFPHALHQGVIARNTQTEKGDSIFVRAVFRPLDDNPPKAVDNCATCHVTDDRAPADVAVGGPEGKFKPAAPGTFKTSPSGHASCFNCHWQ